MVLSRRERIILIVTLACVGLLVANNFIFEPVQAKLSDMEAQREQLLGDLNEADLLLDNQKRMQGKWKALLADGLQNATEAESRVLSALREWADGARFSLRPIK